MRSDGAFKFQFLTLFVIKSFRLLYFQPALLYIVPTVIGSLAAHCFWNGDVKQVRYYSIESSPMAIDIPGTCALSPF